MSWSTVLMLCLLSRSACVSLNWTDVACMMSCIVIVAVEGAMAATMSSAVIHAVDAEAALLSPGARLMVLGRSSKFCLCTAEMLAERRYCMCTSRTTCDTDICPQSSVNCCMHSWQKSGPCMCRVQKCNSQC